MPEIALNVPFDAGEIVHIVTEELQARMRGLSPLQGNKEYSYFRVEFNVAIHLRRAGEQAGEGRDTLAWGNVSRGNEPQLSNEKTDVMLDVAYDNFFESKDPNGERVARDMP